MEEAFLDVGGLEHISGSPRAIAARLRHRVREEVGLAVSVGVASTKVLAKMASRAAKPDGMRVVEAGDEIAFLRPLPVEALWGVGPSTAEKLHARGIATIGELADSTEGYLASFLGRAAARHLHAVARNHDPRPVRRGRRRGSFGSQSALGSSPRTRAEVESRLVALVDRVTRRMRSSGRAGRTVTLRLRFADFSRASRSQTLPFATDSTTSVLTSARSLLETAMPTIEDRGITLVGVAVSGMAHDSAGVQLELPFAGASDALDAAIDELRDRFGPDAIRRAGTLARDPSLTPWLRPGEQPSA